MKQHLLAGPEPITSWRKNAGYIEGFVISSDEA
jgi:hypothetical protein